MTGGRHDHRRSDASQPADSPPTRRPALEAPVAPAAARAGTPHDRDRSSKIDASLTSTTATKLAVRDVDAGRPGTRVTAFIGPSGCGKSTILRCFNRMNDLIPGARVDGDGRRSTARTSTAPTSSRSRCGGGSGWSSSGPNPFPMSIYDNVAYGPRRQARRTARRSTRWSSGPPARRAVGRGQGRAQKKSGLVAVRRPAAAAVHRPRAGDRARGDPDGRAVLRARPDRDAADRGADARAPASVHHRHRHPQHAAGVARQRPDGLLLDGRGPGRATSSRSATRSTSSPTRRTS